MNTYIAIDYGEMSRRAADLIIERIKQKPDSLVCLAAGNTPLGTFSCLKEAVREGRVSFEQCRFVSLDEWVGLGPLDEGSCRETLNRHFFEPCGIPERHIHFFNGMAQDLNAECKAMDDFIRARGQLDLLLLGVGMNGHLGFNEPGVDFELYSHVTDLDSVTKQVSVKYFSERKNVQKGITLGIRHLMEADTVILIASGDMKAEIMMKALRHEVTEEVPVTVLRRHPNVHVCMDEAAAAFVR